MAREKLKRLLRGRERGVASFFQKMITYFIRSLSASSVWTMSSLISGGIDVVLFGLIKCLSVFHQSRGPVSVFLI